MSINTKLRNLIKLTWTKNGEPMLASTRFTTNYEPTKGDIDVDVIFAKAIDTASYKCVAENIYGSDETFCKIEIIDVPNIDERPQTINPDAFKNLEQPLFNIPESNSAEVLDMQPPIVIIPLTDTTLVELEPVILSCKIIGKPIPKVLK